MADRVRLANESAAGVFTFTWADDGAKYAVTWAEGIAPMACSGVYSREIANPGRFGWPGAAEVAGMDSRRQLAAVRQLAQRFADAMMAEL